MVWSNTQPKEKKEGEELGEDEELEDPESEGEAENEENKQQNEEEVVKKQFLKFNEKDLTLRKPLPKYEILKSLETMCLSAGKARDNLKSFVLCSGI